MADPRIEKLAQILVDYSTNIHKDDYVQLLTTTTEGLPLFKQCYRKIIQRGAYVFPHIGFGGEAEIYYKNASQKQLKNFPEILMAETKKATAYIRIGASMNTKELNSIPPEKLTLRSKVLKPILDERIDNTRWVVTVFPTNSLAQEAEMSLEEYEDFVFNATNLDWKAESKKMKKIQAAFAKGKIVRIIDADTDIELSVRGRPGIVADGKNNIPDGELFFAPREDFTRGKIKFTYPSLYGGREVDGISLEFKKGKVVDAKAEKNQNLLKKVINTDADARLVGELAFGMNYGITKFTKNLLFDEKIGGTVHIALGRAYKECKGLSKSAIHWDIVKDLRKSGKVFLDGKLVQEKGKWLI